MTNFWSAYVIILVTVSLVGCAALLFWTRKNPIPHKKEDESVGHSFDGIEELNKPLPQWWLWTFLATIIFAVLYLALYPGFGAFKGKFQWTSQREWQENTLASEKKYSVLYKKYLLTSVTDLQKDSAALQIGAKLFAHNCSQCHGSDAKGGLGFPNLTDHDWLHGGTPEAIEATILNGRKANMPVFTAALGGHSGVEAVAEYVQQLSGRTVNTSLAASGRKKFESICSACHGMDGKGNQSLGAPNLTDSIWLYGGTAELIKETIYNGRNGVMPAHKELLGPAKVHLLTAYVYSLSRQ